MPDLFDLIRFLDDPLGEQKSGGKLGVIARRPHRDRDGTMRPVRKPKTYFERFFDRENVR